VERNFSNLIRRLGRAEATLLECEKQAGIPAWEILRAAPESHPWKDNFLALQADVRCTLAEISAVEMCTRTDKELLKKDYRQFLKVVDLLRSLRTRFLEANLKLVISVARKYRGRGIPFLDLIQEGNLGLMRALDKFDHRLGYKFSTYATWWIRQAMYRVIQDQAQNIRMPVHVIELRNRVIRAVRALSGEAVSKPTLKEVAVTTGLSEEKVEEIICQNEGTYGRTVSLETPVGGGDQLLDFLKDETGISPEEASMDKNAVMHIRTILSTLTSREEQILRKRYGIGEGKTYTLEELGREFGITRERIRQIEAKALNKLRHPSRQKKMRSLAEP
jgi:RNA polymerase primary sigma factor